MASAAPAVKPGAASSAGYLVELVLFRFVFDDRQPSSRRGFRATYFWSSAPSTPVGRSSVGTLSTSAGPSAVEWPADEPVLLPLPEAALAFQPDRVLMVRIAPVGTAPSNGGGGGRAFPAGDDDADVIATGTIDMVQFLSRPRRDYAVQLETGFAVVGKLFASLLVAPAADPRFAMRVRHVRRLMMGVDRVVATTERSPLFLPTRGTFHLRVRIGDVSHRSRTVDAPPAGGGPLRFNAEMAVDEAAPKVRFTLFHNEEPVAVFAVETARLLAMTPAPGSGSSGNGNVSGNGNGSPLESDDGRASPLQGEKGAQSRSMASRRSTLASLLDGIPSPQTAAQQQLEQQQLQQVQQQQHLSAAAAARRKDIAIPFTTTGGVSCALWLTTRFVVSVQPPTPASPTFQPTGPLSLGSGGGSAERLTPPGSAGGTDTPTALSRAASAASNGGGGFASLAQPSGFASMSINVPSSLPSWSASRSGPLGPQVPAPPAPPPSFPLTIVSPEFGAQRRSLDVAGASFVDTPLGAAVRRGGVRSPAGRPQPPATIPSLPGPSDAGAPLVPLVGTGASPGWGSQIMSPHNGTTPSTRVHFSGNGTSGGGGSSGGTGTAAVAAAVPFLVQGPGGVPFLVTPGTAVPLTAAAAATLVLPATPHNAHAGAGSPAVSGLLLGGADNNGDAQASASAAALARRCDALERELQSTKERHERDVSRLRSEIDARSTTTSATATPVPQRWDAASNGIGGAGGSVSGVPPQPAGAVQRRGAAAGTRRGSAATEIFGTPTPNGTPQDGPNGLSWRALPRGPSGTMDGSCSGVENGAAASGSVVWHGDDSELNGETRNERQEALAARLAQSRSGALATRGLTLDSADRGTATPVSQQQHSRTGPGPPSRSGDVSGPHRPQSSYEDPWSTSTPQQWPPSRTRHEGVSVAPSQHSAVRSVSTPVSAIPPAHSRGGLGPWQPPSSPIAEAARAGFATSLAMESPAGHFSGSNGYHHLSTNGSPSSVYTPDSHRPPRVNRNA